MFEKKQKSLKGIKIYGISQGPGKDIICATTNLEQAKSALDGAFPFLVEAVVLRVFTRERDLVEVETEIN